MTQPDPWNGRGQDPWLPQRLEARLDVSAFERSIRSEYLAALSEWLVTTARRVFRAGGVPDLDAVWARTPAWIDAVEHLLRGEILKAIGAAYAKLLGKDFPWEQRVFVTRYLAEVRNRLVRVPDEVHDLIAGQLAAGINLGEGIPKLAARVGQTFSVSGSDFWPNRATTVARTEAIGALNAGRQDAFRAVAEETGETFEKLWLATDDQRTRPTHDLADGQRVPLQAPFIVGGFELQFPGDPTGPPQEVINCRCTQLLVEPGEELDLSARRFRR